MLSQPMASQELLQPLALRTKGKFNHMAADLTDLSETIDIGIKNTETPFLDLGQVLQTAYSESGDLINTITGIADRFSTADGNNFVHDVENAIQDVMGELAEYPVKIKADLEIVKGSSQYLDKLHRICPGLINISRFLNVVGLNIGIEGYRSKESIEMFQGFDKEIKKLAERIGEITGKIYDDTTRVITSHEKGLSGISGKIQTIKRLTKEAEAAVLKTIEDIKILSGHSRNMLEKAEQTAKAIQNMAGEIVMTIQFHDIARQRLEHVISSFEDVRGMLEQNDLSPDNTLSDDIKIPAQIMSILQIQSEQITNVADEIEQAHGNIKNSLEDIRCQVATLQNLLNESSESEDRKSGFETKLESMVQQMNDLKQLETRACVIGDEMIDTIGESSEIVSLLSGYAGQISDINLDIQYKALNAIIMTSRLGNKGATLEVLAREVRNISIECNSLVEDTLKHLEGISKLTSLLKVSNNDETAPIRKEIGLDESIDGISIAVSAYSSDSLTVSENAQTLEKKLEQTGKGLSFLIVWVEQLRQDGLKLEEIITTIEPFADEKLEAHAFNDENLSNRYTMKSERIIHERVTKKGLDTAKFEDESPIEEIKNSFELKEQKETFDNNFELF